MNLIESTTETETKQAVDNNIALCECVAKANGIQTVFVDQVWMTSQPMPPYYPNLITNRPGLDISNHVEHLKGLLSPGWGIKDSFSTLDLEANGFRTAMSGYWFSVLSNTDTQYPLSDDSCVITVRNELDFKRWISAWDSTMDGKIFPQDSWLNKDLEFVLVERANQVVGGFLLNRTNSDIGVSNWFGEIDLINWALRKMISPSQRVFGYTNDNEMDELSNFGYQPLHAMKVWIYK